MILSQYTMLFSFIVYVRAAFIFLQSLFFLYEHFMSDLELGFSFFSIKGQFIQYYDKWLIQIYKLHLMIISKIIKNFTTTSLTKFKHFTQLQAKQLILQQNPLRDIINYHLEMTGQMKIQQYWKLALTHPEFGYYVKQNVFAKEGDFVTSPEISPLFGQMIGIWLIQFLQHTKILNPTTNSVQKKFRIIELGGGRGLLMRDIVKTFQDLKVYDNFDLNFVQVSQYNRKCQQQTVLQQFKKKDHFFRFQHEKSTSNYQSFESQNEFKDVKLCWFNTLQEILQQDTEDMKNQKQIPFTLFVMNQFFDALPTSILEFTESGWRQKVLVKSRSPDIHYDLKVSSTPYPQKMTPNIPNAKIGDTFEISPESLLQIDLMSKMINSYGGCIFNCDYGEEGSFGDSIRAIKDHKYIPSPYFWQIPGECDLSAYVNFSSLKYFAQVNKGITTFQILPQGYFLQAMGIIPRMQILKKNLEEKDQERLESEYNRLVLQSEMGEIYKVQIMTKKEYGDIYPHVEFDEHSY